MCGVVLLNRVHRLATIRWQASVLVQVQDNGVLCSGGAVDRMTSVCVESINHHVGQHGLSCFFELAVTTN
jgi:hypothetical protein